MAIFREEQNWTNEAKRYLFWYELVGKQTSCGKQEDETYLTMD